MSCELVEKYWATKEVLTISGFNINNKGVSFLRKPFLILSDLLSKTFSQLFQFSVIFWD